MSGKPIARRGGHLFQCPGFLEEMGRPRNDLEANIGAHSRSRVLVELDHEFVALTDKEKRRRLDERQRLIREVGAPTPRDNGTHARRPFCRRNEGSAPTGARAEQTQRKAARVWLIREPVDGRDKPVREHTNIESMMPRHLVNPFFFGGEQVEEQGSELGFTKDARHEAIPLTEPAAAAAVREKNDGRRSIRNAERPLKRHTRSGDRNRSFNAIIVVGMHPFVSRRMALDPSGLARQLMLVSSTCLVEQIVDLFVGCL